MIVEVYDNRLLPLASRDYEFTYEIPKDRKGLVVEARVRYHILTDGQHAMLREKYGLRGNDPYVFNIYSREFPLDSTLGVALNTQPLDPRVGCSSFREGTVNPTGHQIFG